MARLLLLDNDERIVELLSWFLRERGFDVETAKSFAEARERMGAARPDLLVSDVDLGAESAVDGLPVLSAEGALPPTLVVSGFLDEEVERKLRAVPEVLDTLSKPFEFTDLEAKVRACLAGEGGPGEIPAPLPELPAEPPAGADAAPTAPPIAAPAPPPAPAPVSEAPVSEAPVSEAPDEGDDDDWIEITPGS